MRLLYWTPRFWPDFGGIQTLSEKALPQLAQKGYEITVFTSHNEDKPPEVTLFHGIEVHRYPFWSTLQTNNILQVAQINQSIHSKIADLQPDLIHYDFSGYTVLYLQSLLKRNPLPYLAAIHGLLPAKLCQPGGTIHSLIEQASQVTAISDSVLKQIQTLIPSVRTKAATIHGFADFAVAEPTPTPAGKPVILGIGRLEREKGFDVLVSAAKLLAEKGLDFEVRLIGDGSLRPALQEQAVELGLLNHVQFIGQAANADLPRQIAQAALVVIPTRGYEAFGLVAAEAGLMGRPVVASRLGGLPEIIQNHETGILVSEEDPQGFADAIEQIITNPEQASEMGQAAHRRIQEHFTLPRYVEAYDHLYQQIVSAHAAN